MTEPRPSVTRFVRAIIHVELARGAEATELEVIQHILTRLYQELGKIIGPAGYNVMLARSLVLARRAHPVLTNITVGPDGTLAGIDDGTRDGAALQEGVQAVVAQFIELLVILIGQDLALRLIGDIWPMVKEEGNGDAP